MATPNTPSANARRLDRVRDFVSGAGSPFADRMRDFFTYLADHPPVAQGTYYVVRGLWPLVGALFFWEQGTVQRFWHAQAMGVLILVIGATLIVAAVRRQQTPEVLCLALGSAAGLALLEFALVIGREISAIYLLDVALQVGLLVMWSMALLRQRTATKPSATPQDVPRATPISTAPTATPVPPAHP